MADYNIRADEQGIYEINLEPNTATTIQVDTRGRISGTAAVITVHEGQQPVYYTTGSKQVTPKASDAEMVIPGQYVETQIGGNRGSILNLVSAGTATVSVSRS